MPTVRESALMRALAVFLMGCWTGASAPTPTPVPREVPVQTATGPLRVELAPHPTAFAFADRAQFILGWTVTNTSDGSLDPALDFANLRINGTASPAFANTIGNAGGEPAWYALPAGGQITRAWRMGPQLFEKPGDYTLVLEVSGILSAPVSIRVSP